MVSRDPLLTIQAILFRFFRCQRTAFGSQTLFNRATQPLRRLFQIPDPNRKFYLLSMAKDSHLYLAVNRGNGHLVAKGAAVVELLSRGY
jgi:hypothetical protein